MSSKLICLSIKLGHAVIGYCALNFLTGSLLAPINLLTQSVQIYLPGATGFGYHTKVDELIHLALQSADPVYMDPKASGLLEENSYYLDSEKLNELYKEVKNKK